jgi:hypothetical protein
MLEKPQAGNPGTIGARPPKDVMTMWKARKHADPRAVRYAAVGHGNLGLADTLRAQLHPQVIRR